MADDDDDLNKALAYLRKHDASHTGAPIADIAAFDVEDPDALNSFEKVSKIGHEPVGPNWKKPGSFATLPDIGKNHPDSAWLMHERQDSTGKYKAWLFFSTVTGQYYKLNNISDAKSGYSLMSTPHDPYYSPLLVRVGNASVQPAEVGKLDLAVLLPDLQKTGFLLKQPLEFLDRPASLFVLCAGLRNSGAAAEFCAKRFHSLLLPKLSSRATVWYDYELVDLVTESVNTLDQMLLDSTCCFAGSSLAVALLAGTRLVVAALGGVRCLLCRPPPAMAGAAKNAAPPKWNARLIGGGDAHTLSNKEERARVEAAGGTLLSSEGGGPEEIYASSAPQGILSSVSDDWEREWLRVSRATNSFAALGISPSDVQEGSKAVRSIFRRRSLLVHPDKVGEERSQRTTAIFSRLESAADAVDAMLQADKSAATLLARIHASSDEGRLVADPAVAAKLLGLQEGCGKDKAKAAAKKMHEPLSRLQNVARLDVERAIKILDAAAETAGREAKSWTPAEADVGVHVTHALGCKDLKTPLPLLKPDAAVEIFKLGLNEPAGLALLTEGTESVPDAAVASCLEEHWPGRPRSAALRLALDSSVYGGNRPALSVVCAFISNVDVASSGGATGLAGAPPAKRARIGRPDRVRVSHVLLRWAGLKVQDEFERPGIPPPTRTQAEAEKELLELADDLLAAKDPRTLGARFKAEVLKRSECSTANNVPHADLGWVDPGGAEPPLEVAAFDTPVGGLSDVVVTTRGAHLMYRLA